MFERTIHIYIFGFEKRGPNHDGSSMFWVLDLFFLSRTLFVWGFKWFLESEFMGKFGLVRELKDPPRITATICYGMVHLEHKLPVNWATLWKSQFGFVILGQISNVWSFRVQFFGIALNSPCGTMVEISSRSIENRPSSATTHRKWHYWVITLKSGIITLLWEVLDLTCFEYLVSIFDLVLFSDSHRLWEFLRTFNH